MQLEFQYSINDRQTGCYSKCRPVMRPLPAPAPQQPIIGYKPSCRMGCNMREEHKSNCNHILCTNQFTQHNTDSHCNVFHSLFELFNCPIRTPINHFDLRNCSGLRVNFHICLSAPSTALPTSD